jgi:hypothetical protein
MIMDEESNADKTVEVARIIFHVATPLTVVVDQDGRRTLRTPGASPPPDPIDAADTVQELTGALNDLVQNTAGTEFSVAQVEMRASDSIVIIAVVVASYLAVRQGVEVLDTMQKVAGLGRWLVQAVMRTRGRVDSVHGRVDISPATAAIGRTGTRSRSASGAASGSSTLASSISTRGPLLLAILNLLITGAVLAVVLLTR